MDCCENSFTNPEDLLPCTSIKMSEILPSDSLHEFEGSNGQILIHLIHSKQKLSKLLLQPMYYLFPLTLESLDDEKWKSTSFRMQDWIDGNDKVQLIAETDFHLYDQRCLFHKPVNLNHGQNLRYQKEMFLILMISIKSQNLFFVLKIHYRKV